jgi:hypothetical protein
VGSADGVEVSAHGFLQRRLTACGLRKWIGHGGNTSGRVSALPARIIDRRVTLAMVHPCQ